MQMTSLNRVLITGDFSEEPDWVKTWRSGEWQVECIALRDLESGFVMEDFAVIVLHGRFRPSEVEAVRKCAGAYTPLIFYGKVLSSDDRLESRRLGVLCFVYQDSLVELKAAIHNILWYTTPVALSRKIQPVFINAFTKTAEQLIEEKPSFGVKDVCDRLGVSPSTLYRKVKEATNRSPNRLIAAYRSEKARALLRDTDMNVTEIAYACGFTSATYFSRTFKQIYKETPGQYRKNIYD